MVQGSRLHMHTYWLLSADLYYMRGEIRSFFTEICAIHTSIYYAATIAGMMLDPTTEVCMERTLL